MSTEQNKAIVRRFVEESLNARSSDFVDDFRSRLRQPHGPWGTRGLQTILYHDTLGLPRSQDGI